MLLQELEVSLHCNFFLEEGDTSCSPDDGDDITLLLQNLPALPKLRTVRIRASQRCVGPIDLQCLSHFDHLKFSCTELKLRAGGCGCGWDPTKGPRSFLVIAERPSLETVGSSPSANLP